jgi:hypothetical protein
MARAAPGLGVPLILEELTLEELTLEVTLSG